MENSESRENAGKKGKGNPPIEYTWKKGESGNPEGSKKGVPKFKTVLKRFSGMEVSFKDMKTGENLSGVPIDIVAAKCLELAMNGSDKHMRIYLEYLEGKALQQIEIINNETRYDLSTLTPEQRFRLMEIEKEKAGILALCTVINNENNEDE